MTTIEKEIGYFGLQGSFTHVMAIESFPGQNHLSFLEIEEMIEAVAEGKIDAAVIPFENSGGGVVPSSLESLAKMKNVYITDERYKRIQQCLIGVVTEEGPKKEIKKITSHPQALQQCKVYIKNLHAMQSSSGSTSAAIEKIAQENDRESAAIGSEKAFELYKFLNPNLRILAHNIQDYKDNQTRFFVLKRKGVDCQDKVKKCKTTIVFEILNSVGALEKILHIFSEEGINVTHISSWPCGNWNYKFFLEYEGPKEIAALVAVETKSIRILGSYERAEKPLTE